MFYFVVILPLYFLYANVNVLKHICVFNSILETFREGGLLECVWVFKLSPIFIQMIHCKHQVTSHCAMGCTSQANPSESLIDHVRPNLKTVVKVSLLCFYSKFKISSQLPNLYKCLSSYSISIKIYISIQRSILFRSRA